MALIRGTKCKFPCPICLVPREKLSKLDTNWPLRSASQSAKIVNESKDMNMGSYVDVGVSNVVDSKGVNRLSVEVARKHEHKCVYKLRSMVRETVHNSKKLVEDRNSLLVISPHSHASNEIVPLNTYRLSCGTSSVGLDEMWPRTTGIVVSFTM